MEGVCFGDLSVRLGAHYLFQHQGAGACEHIIIFTDCRLHSEHEDGPLVGAAAAAAGAYPQLKSQARFRRRRCVACAVRFASLAVYGHPEAENNPEYLCGGCFAMLEGLDEGEGEDEGGVGVSAAAEAAAAARGFFVMRYVHDLLPISMSFPREV